MNYSINKYANILVQNLKNNHERLSIGLNNSGPLGSSIIDAGIDYPGSIEAGIRISEICLGGLGVVEISSQSDFKNTIKKINVHASKPILACLGSQYAGWSLNCENFFSLGSGPARSLALKEEIFSKLNYKDKSSSTSIVLEVDKIPPEEIVNKISADCGVKSTSITFILTPTTSICGTIQVVSRVLEVAIHKIHELKFPLHGILYGFATAPIPPVANDLISGMGRTNDAIIYGGKVNICIDGNEDDIIQLTNKLPSLNSIDYGKPFKQIFLDNNKDFYKIDGSLFSPAEVLINSKRSGKTYSAGRINSDLVEKSFSS